MLRGGVEVDVVGPGFDGCIEVVVKRVECACNKCYRIFIFFSLSDSLLPCLESVVGVPDECFAVEVPELATDNAIVERPVVEIGVCCGEFPVYSHRVPRFHDDAGESAHVADSVQVTFEWFSLSEVGPARDFKFLILGGKVLKEIAWPLGEVEIDLAASLERQCKQIVGNQGTNEFSPRAFGTA